MDDLKSYRFEKRNLHIESAMKEKEPTKKARTILVGVFTCYVLTVAINLGEFWPFSIYPMFSQGGKTWTRSMVRDVSNESYGAQSLSDSTISWEETTLADISNITELPGAPFSVKANGVDPIDLANFVSKTKTWDQVRVAALEHMLFNGAVPDRSLMIYRVQGRLSSTGNVEVSAKPYVLITPGVDALHPSLIQ